jgi:hypothetical protein
VRTFLREPVRSATPQPDEAFSRNPYSHHSIVSSNPGELGCKLYSKAPPPKQVPALLGRTGTCSSKIKMMLSKRVQAESPPNTG